VPARERLWERDFVLLLATLLAGFASVHLLVADAPLVVERAGGSSTEAGLANTLLYGITVPIQLATPWLMGRHDPRRLMALALALLGLPALAVAARPETALIFVSMAFRGAGFAVLGVVTYAIVAEIAPRSRRAEAFGVFGLAIGISNVLGPSAGLYLNDLGGASVPFAIAGGAALVGIFAAAAIRTRAWVQPPPGGTVRRALRQRAVFPVFVSMTIVTLVYGSLVTFTPLALTEHGLSSAAVFLLCAGSFSFVARYLAGRRADRVGAARLLVPGFACALLGLVAFAFDFGDARVLIPAAAVFGAGLGTLLTALQTLTYERIEGADYALASVFWNVAWDIGFALGAFGLGGVASLSSYGYAFWVLPFLWLGGLVVAVAARRPAPGAGPVPPQARSAAPT
jgi:predicted MFS family arabinose efflux permease